MGRSDETRCANEGPASRTGRPWLLSSDADLFEVELYELAADSRTLLVAMLSDSASGRTSGTYDG